TTDSQITKLIDQVTHLQVQNDLLRAENDKIKQHYKELYDSIKITRAKHIKQVTNLTNENVNLKTYVSKATVNPQVSTQDKHAIDVEPIVPRLRNNRNAHLDYLRHLKESVETIRDIVEEAKVVRPLDRSIVSAFRYTKHSQELLEYTIGTCPQGSQPRAKQLAHISLIRKKQKTNVPVPPFTGVNSCPNASRSQPKSHVKLNRISLAKGDNKLPVDDQPRKNKSHLRTSNRIDSSSRLKRTVINSHSNSIFQTCNKCLTPFNHDLCVATCLQSAMATPSIRYNSSVERNVKQVWKPKQVRQVWKPTGKVLTTIGYQWRPTGRIFNLGNQCPLTKFTPTKVVSATQHKKRANTMADMTALTGQAPTMALPVRTNDQILPRIRWVQTGYLKFSAKGTKREVFGMPIPGSLITADLREASYYQEYLANVTKHRRFLVSETGHLRMCKDFPTKMMKMFLLVENLRKQNPNNHEVHIRNVNSVSKDHVKPKVLSRGKYAIDVEPILPRLRNNRKARLNYLMHLKESVETIRDIVEEAKVVSPFDRSIISACRYTKHSQELLEYAIGTCPQDSYQRDKQLAYIPLIRKKQVTFAKPFDTSNSNTHKHVAKVNTQKTIVHVPPSTGVNRFTNASGSQPRSNTKKNRISPTKGVNKLQVKDQPRTNKSHLRTLNREILVVALSVL
nr:hypothetical protein [Tanacetum cinerariifolium]